VLEFKRKANEWFELVINLKEVHINKYPFIEFIDSENLDAFKGLIWTCGNF